MPNINVNDTVDIRELDFIYHGEVKAVNGDFVEVWVTTTQATTVPISAIVSVNGTPLGT